MRNEEEGFIVPTLYLSLKEYEAFDKMVKEEAVRLGWTIKNKKHVSVQEQLKDSKHMFKLPTLEEFKRQINEK